jgi:hypothetical protein
MSFTSYINTLKSKHANLKNRIKDFYSISKDNIELTELKKQKLQLKEKIASLASQQSN